MRLTTWRASLHCGVEEKLRSRFALVTTASDDRAMAAAAVIGLSWIPMKGKDTSKHKVLADVADGRAGELNGGSCPAQRVGDEGDVGGLDAGAGREPDRAAIASWESMTVSAPAGSPSTAARIGVFLATASCSAMASSRATSMPDPASHDARPTRTF